MGLHRLFQGTIDKYMKINKIHWCLFIISLLCIILALAVYNSNSLNQLSSDDLIAAEGLNRVKEIARFVKRMYYHNNLVDIFPETPETFFDDIGGERAKTWFANFDDFFQSGLQVWSKGKYVKNLGLIKLFNAPNHIVITAAYKDEYKRTKISLITFNGAHTWYCYSDMPKMIKAGCYNSNYCCPINSHENTKAV